MLLDIVKKGSTDRSVTIRIIDSADGTPETGVVFNTSGIDLWYRREGADKVSITEADLTTPALDDAHADGGFLHISDGYYRLDLPDAAFATGANHVDVGGTVTDMVVIGGRVRLVDYDLEDSVRLGLTALPNAAADAAGGLPISDAGGLDLDAEFAKLDTIDDYLDTEIAAILAAVDTEIAALPTAAEIVNEWETQSQADPTGFHVNVMEWNSTGGLNTQLNMTSGVNTPVIALGTISPLADDATVTRLQSCFDGTITTLDALDTAQDTQHATTQGKIDTVDDFLDTEIASILAAVDTEVAAILADTGTDIPATLAGLFTTALTESYRGTGATGTVAQLLYEVLANLVEFANSGTTRTAKKLDGSTTAKTYTYDDATSPTSITETT